MERPLWQPSPDRTAASGLAAFTKHVRERHGVRAEPYAALYDWSVSQPAEFWSAVWDFCGVRAQTKGGTVLADGDRMPGARWFPDARLNFAENLLRRKDDGTAVIFWGEDRLRSRITYAELHAEV